MKKETEHIEKFFELYSSRKAKRYLANLVSPLEAALIKNRFQPFVFIFDGSPVYINAFRCKQLQKQMSESIMLFAEISDKENKSANIPFELRDTFDDPAELMELPYNTRQQLVKLEVYNMYYMQQLGRGHFVKLPGFGIESVKAIDLLFKKHQCSHLFK